MFDFLTRKRHYIEMDEKDLTNVMAVINAYTSSDDKKRNLLIGNCAWVQLPSKWFVHFDCPNKVWPWIEKGLKQIESVHEWNLDS